MSVNENPGSGAPGANGGAEGGQRDDSSQNNQSNTGNQPKTVSWENHQRALTDLHSFKQKTRELEEKLGNIESDRLREKNDFETLYKNEKAKREQVEGDLKKMTNWTLHTQKFNAVKAEAVAAGLRKEAIPDLELLDLDDVKVETTDSGRFIVEGAKEKVEKLKATKGYWFQAGPPPTVNAGGTGAGGGEAPKSGLTKIEDVVKAERDFKAGRLSQAEYHRIHKKYCDENPRKAAQGQPPGRTPPSDKS